MSTDWTTGKNKYFGKDEILIKKCKNFEKLGLGSFSELCKLHEDYNIYKLNNINKSEYLYNTYEYVNNYTNNIWYDLLILSGAYNYINNNQNNNILFNKTNEISSINDRKIILQDELNNLFFNKGKCLYFQINTFFPHLDTVNKIDSIEQVPLDINDKNRPEYEQKLIPCYELGYETFYALISYTDSCGQDELVPVPDMNELTLARNTLIHPNAENAKYKWIIHDKDNNLLYKPSLTDKYLEVASPSSSILDNVDIELQYSEG